MIGQRSAALQHVKLKINGQLSAIETRRVSINMSISFYLFQRMERFAVKIHVCIQLRCYFISARTCQN